MSETVIKFIILSGQKIDQEYYSSGVAALIIPPLEYTRGLTGLA